MLISIELTNVFEAKIIHSGHKNLFYLGLTSNLLRANSLLTNVNKHSITS